jgi:PAS domain S-box-containing protein
MNTWWQKIKTYWKGLPIESRGSIAIAIPLVCLMGSVITDTLLYQKNVTPAKIQFICGEIAIGIISTALAIRLLRQLATELRKHELGLEESRNLLQTIVANIVDGVITIDPHGKVTTFNHAAEKMFGYTSTEAIGCDWQKLLIERDDLTQKLKIYLPGSSSKLIPTGKIWQAIGQRNNGEWFPIEVSINSIPFDNDLIAIVRDITERQQAEAKLQVKASELIALNASLTTINDCLIQKNHELDQFTYITSHDLKAPLRAISSLSEWIEEDLDKHLSGETRFSEGDALRTQMHLLRSRVHRMQALLDALLEYSRAGNNFSPITTVDINALLPEIIQTIDPPTTFTIRIGPMPILNTCKQPLKQIFAHSIDNAIRHHPTKMGIVEISAIDLGDRYEFAIADDGDGIEPQFHDRIYTIFQTLKPRDVQENIGAGLAIVKKIALAQGGTVQLESAAGNGAIFRFTWLKQPTVIEDVTTKHKQ